MSRDDVWHAANAHRGSLIAYAVRLGLSRPEAEDVASECIVRAVEKEDIDADRIGLWLRRVAHNLAVDVHRARPATSTLGRLHRFMSEVHEPHAYVDDRLEADWVAGLVARLPERQRSALQHKASGLSLSEIAAQMNETYKTVESLLSRARGSIRTTLGTASAFLLVIFFGRRRPPLTALPVAGAIAAASLSVLYVWTPAVTPHPPAPISLRLAIPAFLPSRTVAPLRPASNAKRMSHERSPSSLKMAVADPIQPTTQLVAPGQAGPVRHGAVEVTRSHKDESLVDSTMRCLRNGVDINPDRIGCR